MDNTHYLVHYYNNKPISNVNDPNEEEGDMIKKKKKKDIKNMNKKGSLGNGKKKEMKLSTEPQSVAARERRHKISEKFKILQSLVPGGTKMDTASMLEQAIQYVKFLKSQIWLHQAASIFNFDHINHVHNHHGHSLHSHGHEQSVYNSSQYFDIDDCSFLMTQMYGHGTCLNGTDHQGTEDATMSFH